jgi:hypothetical protein
MCVISTCASSVMFQDDFERFCVPKREAWGQEGIVMYFKHSMIVDDIRKKEISSQNHIQ